MTDKKPERTRRQDGGDQPPRRRVPPPRAPQAAAASAFEGERIAKVMARAGACSRRDAEQWIAEGRVSVNGRRLDSPAFNVSEGDRIEVDGVPLAAREPTRLFLFHKPAGLVTSAKDEEGRETVFGFLAERFPELPRLVSVGRLDINTEGLLLFTNDGGLARTLELPATGWTRRYRVRAHGEVDQARLDELREGVTVEGVDYQPIEARLDRVQGANAWITMTLREGKNREIKRVLEHLGLAVNRLIRISFGPFQLGELGEGVIEEVRLKTLREQLGKGLAELAGVDFSSPRRESEEPPHVAAEEARQRAKTRARKHVATLRAEREEERGTKGRARIERGATSDRKGRAVTVEKITPVRRGVAEEPPAASRNARRFRAERTDGAPEGRGPQGRGPQGRERGEREAGRRRFETSEGREERSGAARPAGRRAEGFGDKRGSDFRAARPPRREGESRPFRRDKEAGGFGERREGFGGERRGRSFSPGEKPRGERPPRREGEARPFRRDKEAGGFGERREGFGGERRGKSFSPGDKPRGERPPRRERSDTHPPSGDRSEKFARAAPRGGKAGEGPRRGPPRGGGPGKGPRKPGGAPRKPR